MAIEKYQRVRNEANEQELRRAIGAATEFCAQFKPLIPGYKQRYFDVLERADQLGLTPRDLIMTFDRAIYELHTRMERSQKQRDALGPWSQKMLEILDGRRAIEEVSVVSEVESVGGRDFITSGRVVVGGRRVGPIRVIHETRELEQVQPGEIVACRMTTPDFVMAIDSIAGLITEQGGVVCHAAILAREFNIPCVVGCGPFLSQVKTGQVVELDATNGLLFG